MLVMDVVLGPPVVPIDEVQMKPCFVMATLICGTYTKRFPWNGKCTSEENGLSSFGRGMKGPGRGHVKGTTALL